MLVALLAWLYDVVSWGGLLPSLGVFGCFDLNCCASAACFVCWVVCM